MSNTTGSAFKVTTFGESHGAAIGAVIDGCPAGLDVNSAYIQKQLDRRKPGQSAITSQRKEDDKIVILSGVYEGRSTGAPIALIIYNHDQRSDDYQHLKDAYRPSHADFTWEKKYNIRDERGGGRSSARTTAALVAAGAIAMQLTGRSGISIHSYVSQVGQVKVEKKYQDLDLGQIDNNLVRCPDETSAKKMIELIEKIKSEGDTIGGSVSCVIKNPPAGLGEPLYNKLHADLSKAMMGINAVHGFDYGAGFESIEKKGSELNDVFMTDSAGRITTRTNFSGGIQGGISNGNDIFFRVLFKPVATLQREQETVNKSGEKITIDPKGRHDPCVLPRAVPIVDAMAALVIADHILLNRSSVI